ncbi:MULTISPECIES: hypothetical protein [unclassified Saccharopolyspora]|uniref:hypothetical protein n=1 Tax=Saccharopolyspora TaxID=1835 RepID=UPI001F1CD345|nr:hypothetical protein [Saccharopolyspora sp. HNM0986]
MGEVELAVFGDFGVVLDDESCSVGVGLVEFDDGSADGRDMEDLVVDRGDTGTP